MSVYILIGICLLIGALIEIILKKTSVYLYKIEMVVMAFLLIFRFGQGTDYFGYWWLYNEARKIPSINEFLNLNTHGEAGWRILTFLTNNAGITFPLFVSLIAVIEMYFLDRFICKFCRYKMMALFLAYPTLYLTYLFSALRQGLIMTIFLGFLLECYLNKQYKKYFIVSILCMSVHISAVIFIIIPLLDIVLKNAESFWKLIGVSWGIGLVLSTGVFNGILGAVLPSAVMHYFRGNTISFAVIERIVTYIVVSILYVRTKDKDNVSETDTLYKLYSYGMMLYGILMYVPSVASRIGYIFKCLEIAIVSNKLNIKNKYRKLCITYFVVLSVFMFTKNIDSYISQGLYYDNVNVLNYPYVSVFQQDDIYKYRYINYQIDSDWY